MARFGFYDIAAARPILLRCDAGCGNNSNEEGQNVEGGHLSVFF